MQMALGLVEPKKKGGKREGAGRPKTGTRRDPLHRTRPEVTRHQPQHVTLRVVNGLGRLRRRTVYHAVRKAMQRSLERKNFRVCHVSLQHNHLHFIVEADSKLALERGMQGLAISAAKRINALSARRKGKVFQFRFHATRIGSPRQARNALAYVLNNWRRHREDQVNRNAATAAVDPYSSAVRFDGWKEQALAVLPPGFNPNAFVPLPVAAPKSWLLTVGWKRHGPISVFETPGPLAAKK
jgi:REP element-mobilizing transposase RayT